MQAPTLPRPLWRRLRRIRPSRDGSLLLRPCRVLLKEGRWVDRVYLVDEAAYLRLWKMPPGEDASRRPLPAEEIVDVAESPTRLPARFADRLYRAGESGAGYTCFTLVLKGGRRLPYMTGHAVDFPQWPDDVTPDLVREVLPHEVPAEFKKRTPLTHEASAPHLWCLYRPPRPRWPRVAAAAATGVSWVCAAVLADFGRQMLATLPAVGVMADLLRGVLAPGPAALAAVAAALGWLLQAGLILAPLVRRRGRWARLLALAAMLPALGLGHQLIRAGRAGWWASFAGPRWRIAAEALLWLVPVVNAAILAASLARRSAPLPPAGAASNRTGRAGDPDTESAAPGPEFCQAR
jgi:hypothetical protein